MEQIKERLPSAAAIIEQGTPAGQCGQLFVSLHGKPIVDDAWGTLPDGRKATPDMLVGWASCTKPTTCTLAAMLWEKGRLDLDDPVVKFIPEFAPHGKEKVTIRHLLTHSGALGGFEGPMSFVSWEDTLARVCAAPREANQIGQLRRQMTDAIEEPSPPPPLGVSGYDQTGIFILGEVIRRLCDRSFEEIVRSELFEPCRMYDSWVGIPIELFPKYRERIAPAGQSIGFPQFTNPSAHWMAMPMPYGGGIGPIRELGRFYEMFLGKGKIDGQCLLLPQTVEAMTARQVTHFVNYGLGFMLNFGTPGQAAALAASQQDHPSLDTPTPPEELTPEGMGRRVVFGLHASTRTFGHEGVWGVLSFADPKYGLVVSHICNGFQARLATAIYEDLGLVESPERLGSSL
jgi:CubicO group peptidase (beta-lactamase class C family)